MKKTIAKAYRRWRRCLLWERVRLCRHLPSTLHVTCLC